MDSCLEPGDITGPSPLICRDRWLALQRLREAAGVDAVLIILGPDAQFSRGSEVAFNWLLGGLGGRDLLAAPLEAKYEECVVCLRATRSVVFCKREVQDEVVARTSMWESCEVVVPTREEEADQDLYDARRIAAFIDMVAPCASLGLALRHGDEQADLKMSIERWPLVQAYGYDEYGMGFLTLKKSVVNLEPQLQFQVYAGWDLQTAVRAQGLVSQLSRAWGEALLVQDKCSPAGPGAPEGTTAAAPLTDHFEYGRLALSDEDILELRGVPLKDDDAGALLNPAPRVLIGPTFSAQVLGPSTLEAPSGPQPGEAALHMVWEAVDPVMGIAATRTYALSSDFSSDGPTGPQLHVLLRAYAAAAACCRHLLSSHVAVAAFSRNRAAELQQAADAYLGGCVAGTVHVDCMPMDTMGMSLTGAPLESGVVQLFVRVAVTDICCSGGREILGTVAHGDTALCTRASPAAPPAGCACTTLTDGLPAFAFWPAPGALERSGRVKADMDLALGVGQDPGPFVALGHRSGMKVHLNPPGPPPDPLGLGTVIDSGVKGMLALDIGPLLTPDQPLVAQAQGTVWTFSSGKAVLSSPRTGYLLLQACHGGLSMEAANGLIWVLVECADWTMGNGTLHAALAVTPSTAAQWRTLVAVEEGVAVTEVESLQWVEGSKGAEVSSEFMVAAALTTSHAGHMPPEMCSPLFCNPDLVLGSDGRCRCIWIAGLPGCGALDVASGLAKALSAPLVDLSAVAGLGLEARMEDTAAVAAALAQELAAKAPGQPLAVVCDVRCAPQVVLTELGAQRPLADAVEITHVVSVLEPSVAYPWGSVRNPLMLSRAHRGWVSVVVVQDPVRPGSAAASRRESQALGARLAKELKACRGAAAPVLLNTTVGALLEQDGPLQQLTASLPLRSLATPGFAASAPAPEATTWSLGRPHARLDCVFVPTQRPLDVAAFRSHCAQLLAAAEQQAVSTWRGLFCIEARISGAVATDLYTGGHEPAQLLNTLRGGEALAAHNLVRTPKRELPTPHHWPAPLAEASGVLLWWCLAGDSEAAKAERYREAHAAVQACYLQPPPMRPCWTTEDVSAAELEQLEEELRVSGLPAGYFFNGVHYVDVDGNESHGHPELAARLDAYVAQHNLEVEAWNAMAREAGALPIFTGGAAVG